jgi:hypothetical protein
VASPAARSTLPARRVDEKPEGQDAGVRRSEINQHFPMPSVYNQVDARSLPIEESHMSEHTLNATQLAAIRLDFDIAAAQRRLNDAGRSTQRGAHLANHLAQLLAEKRALTEPKPSESDHDRD